MKLQYTYSEGRLGRRRGKVDLRRTGTEMYYVELYVPQRFRGRGIGTVLMTRVCADADQEQQTLHLWPRMPKLHAFYRSFDFELLEDKDTMIRLPQRMREANNMKAALEAYRAKCPEEAGES